MSITPTRCAASATAASRHYAPPLRLAVRDLCVFAGLCCLSWPVLLNWIECGRNSGLYVAGTDVPASGHCCPPVNCSHTCTFPALPPPHASSRLSPTQLALPSSLPDDARFYIISVFNRRLQSQLTILQTAWLRRPLLFVAL